VWFINRIERRGAVDTGGRFRIRSSVGDCSIDFSVFSECESNFLVKGVDEEITKLVLVYFTVYLLGIRHIFSKQTSQLTGFVMY
jgi:hypothetical protein